MAVWRRDRRAGLVHEAPVAAALMALSAFSFSAERAAADEIASDWVEGFNSRTRLSAARLSEGSGQKLYAFVEIEMPKGWKTYWKVPGDSGVPPAFDWSRSDNVEQATVLYPAPRRIEDKGGEVVGYLDKVVFPVEIQEKNKDLPAGLDLVMQFGICKDICIPADVNLSLAIGEDDVGEASATALAALERVPRSGARIGPEDPMLKKVTAELEGAKPRLIIEAAFPGGAESAEVFLEAPGGAYLPPARKTATTGDVATFEVDLADGVDVASLRGALLAATLVSARGQSTASFRIE